MSDSRFGLEGKRAIVLGGGFGMGEATSNLLADLGCHVAVLDIIPERAERVAADVARKGVKGVPVIADVLDDEALLAGIARADKELGGIDKMASIVGMAHMESSLDVDMDSWDLDHRRNLRYIFIAARTVARRLVERGQPGAMASIASVDGVRASQGHASYGSAKAGLISMAKSLAGEWAQYNIRYNIVAPGVIVTPRNRSRGAEADFEQMRLVPFQRHGDVSDIANAMVFFLSDLAKYVTGQTMAIDGGLTAVGPIDYSAFSKMKGVTGIDQSASGFKVGD